MAQSQLRPLYPSKQSSETDDREPFIQESWKKDYSNRLGNYAPCWTIVLEKEKSPVESIIKNYGTNWYNSYKRINVMKCN